jgi:hypothetical protein
MAGLLKKLFGISSAPKAAPKRPTSRLELERLDERMLLSATGTVSQVVDHNGDRVTFFIDNNGVLERNINGRYTQAVDPWGCHCDKQVSAGTDAYGNAVAYVLNGYGSLWQIGWGWGGNLYEQKVNDNVTSFSAVLYGPAHGLKGVWGGTQGGVYYISNGWDLLYQTGSVTLLSGGQYDAQISAGTDDNGYSVNYVLNKYNWDVYERYAVGSWSGDLTNNHWTTQVVGGVHGFWYTNDGSQDVFVHHGFVGTDFKMFLVSGAVQISAGTDPWGSSTVDMLTAWGDWIKYDSGFGWNSSTYLMGTNVWEVAAGDGYDYYVDRYDQLHEVDWGLNDQWIGGNVR